MTPGRRKARSVSSALAKGPWPSRARAPFCLVSLALLLPFAARAEAPATTTPPRGPPPPAPPVSPPPPLPLGSVRAGDARQLESTYGRLPMTFIENKGQEDDRAKFYLRSRNQTLWITDDGVVFALLRATEPRTLVASPEGRRVRQRRAPPERLVFTQQFLNSSRRVAIEPRQLLPGTHNYYLGKDPSHWRPGVRGWGEVLYRDIWTGVDLRLYGNGRHLEQEFVVKPGGDPASIRVAYRGIEGLHIGEDGPLVIRTAFGELKESAPTIYQEIDGKRVAVTGRFKLLGPTAYTFEVGPYVPRYALVIDPTLVYATYLGGSLDDNALGIAVDGNGNAY